MRWIKKSAQKSVGVCGVYKVPQKKHRLKQELPQKHKNNNYLAWLHNQSLTCMSCGKQNGIELHHVKRYSSDPKDDRKVIPLCGVECHRLGTVLSAHGTPVKFREEYPMEYQEAYAQKLYSLYKGQECE